MSRLTISYITVSIDPNHISVNALGKLITLAAGDNIDIHTLTPTTFVIKKNGVSCGSISQENETSPVLIESNTGSGQMMFNILQATNVLYTIIAFRAHVIIGTERAFDNVIQKFKTHFMSNKGGIATRALSKDTFIFSRYGKYPVCFTVNQLPGISVVSIIHNFVQPSLSAKIIENGGIDVERIEDLSKIFNHSSEKFLVPTIIKQA